MKRSLVLVVVTLLVLGSGAGIARGAEPGQTAPATVSTPHDAAAHDQTTAAAGHDHAAMLAAQAAAAPSEIDVLLKKMQSAKGQARINIMADVITKLAAEHQAAQAAPAAPATKAGGAAASGGMCGSHGSSANGAGHEMSCPMCAAHMKAEAAK